MVPVVATVDPATEKNDTALPQSQVQKPGAWLRIQAPRSLVPGPTGVWVSGLAKLNLAWPGWLRPGPVWPQHAQFCLDDRLACKEEGETCFAKLFQVCSMSESEQQMAQQHAIQAQIEAMLDQQSFQMK